MPRAWPLLIVESVLTSKFLIMCTWHIHHVFSPTTMLILSLHMSVMNALYKTIFWVTLLYQCDKLCLLHRGFPSITESLCSLNNCVDASPVHCDEWPLQNIFSESLLYWLCFLVTWKWLYWGFPSVSDFKLCLPEDLNKYEEASLYHWWAPITKPSSE